jgi:hypothetical protein
MRCYWMSLGCAAMPSGCKGFKGRACRAKNENLFNRALQYGASTVCADPVTGSSGMPIKIRAALRIQKESIEFESEGKAPFQGAK